MRTDNRFRLAVMPGDGIGVEVMEAGLAVLDAVEERYGLNFDRIPVPGGALYFKETGTPLDEAGFVEAERADAVLFGAMGWPEVRYPDGTEIAPQLDLRVRLDLYAGVRPIRAIPGVRPTLADPRAADIDLVILRESTEGMFVSRGKGEVTATEARDTQVITRRGTERLSRFAFELARRRKADRGTRGEVTLVDKANVFRSFAFMRSVFDEVALAYPDVGARHHYIDAMALDLVRRPWDFDVLPTENLFGDILSDLGAGLIGGMGFAPSADVGDEHALFQPSHGSAPDIAGRGIANPTAMILSIGMMLDWLGDRHREEIYKTAASELETAVHRSFASGASRTFDIGGTTTTAEVARAVIDALHGGPRSGSAVR